MFMWIGSVRPSSQVPTYNGLVKAPCKTIIAIMIFLISSQAFDQREASREGRRADLSPQLSAVAIDTLSWYPRIHAAVNLVQTRGLSLYEKSNERLLRRWRLWREVLQQSESKVSICTISYQILRYHISSFYPSNPEHMPNLFSGQSTLAKWSSNMNVSLWFDQFDLSVCWAIWGMRWEQWMATSPLHMMTTWKRGTAAVRVESINLHYILSETIYYHLFLQTIPNPRWISLSCTISVGKFKLISFTMIRPSQPSLLLSDLRDAVAAWLLPGWTSGLNRGNFLQRKLRILWQLKRCARLSDGFARQFPITPCGLVKAFFHPCSPSCWLLIPGRGQSVRKSSWYGDISWYSQLPVLHCSCHFEKISVWCWIQCWVLRIGRPKCR